MTKYRWLTLGSCVGCLFVYLFLVLACTIHYNTFPFVTAQSLNTALELEWKIALVLLVPLSITMLEHLTGIERNTTKKEV